MMHLLKRFDNYQKPFYNFKGIKNKELSAKRNKCIKSTKSIKSTKKTNR